MEPTADASIPHVFRQLSQVSMRTVTAHILPVIYLIMKITGFTWQELLGAAWVLVPPLVLIGGVGPHLLLKSMVTRTLSPLAPGEPSGARLERILRLPQAYEVGLIVLTALGTALYAAVPTFLYPGKSVWVIPWAVVTVVLLGMLSGIHTRLMLEHVLRPHAIQEFQAQPDLTLAGSGFTWPRYGWYLPYAFGLFIITALLVSFTVVGREVHDVYAQALTQVDSAPAGHVSPILRASMSQVLEASVLPLVLLNGYLLVVAALSALSLARHLAAGAKSVQESMQSLAAGSPSLPQWASTDEMGDLALATSRAFSRLRDFALSLRESAGSLKHSAEELGRSTTKQTEVLTLQAAALQETQVTAQEIKETSSVATQKAENVLRQTELAREISQEGAEAIQRSLDGLKAIQAQVNEMASRIRALDERAQQIGRITESVKSLADRSNMLALNAAIEAVRSGEHGKGFGVVAREIRSLADQSIKATHNVGVILEDISAAIRTTAAITEAGSEKVGTSLEEIRGFGETLQQLSGIVRDNAQSVRQITTAVTQQGSGITQIFQAVSDLSTMMDQTMSQLNTSQGAVELVRDVSQQVSGFLGDYGWQATNKDRRAP